MGKLSASQRLYPYRGGAQGFNRGLLPKVRLGGLLLLAALVLAVRPPAISAGGNDTAPPDTTDSMDTRAAVAEMDRLYGEILQRFNSEKVFVEKIRAAQNAWCNYRDAHLEALYPAEDKTLVYGSAYRHCHQIALVDLTLQRIKHLRLWLDGVEEGDICAGSRPHQ